MRAELNHDPLAKPFLDGAIRALRKRAASQRDKAALGITVIDCHGGAVSVIASEARWALNLASDLDDIAAELAREEMIR